MYEFTKQMNEKTKNLTVFLMTLETACENIDIKSINSMVASYQKFLSLNEEILSIVNKTTLKDDADILNG
jgi:hypothetical protein